jgi:hypothetical protein
LFLWLGARSAAVRKRTGRGLQTALVRCTP